MDANNNSIRDVLREDFCVCCAQRPVCCRSFPRKIIWKTGSDLFHASGSEKSSMFGVGRRSWQLLNCINTKFSKKKMRITNTYN